MNPVKKKHSIAFEIIQSISTEKTESTMKFLKECLLKEVLFQGMDERMINDMVDTIYRIDCPNRGCITKPNESDDAYL